MSFLGEEPFGGHPACPSLLPLSPLIPLHEAYGGPWKVPARLFPKPPAILKTTSCRTTTRCLVSKMVILKCNFKSPTIMAAKAIC